MSSASLVVSEVVSEVVVVGEIGGAGVSPAKRGRPARVKVVKEVDWLSGLSSGRELVVDVLGSKSEKESSSKKSEKKSEALALKEAFGC